MNEYTERFDEGARELQRVLDAYVRARTALEHQPIALAVILAADDAVIAAGEHLVRASQAVHALRAEHEHATVVIADQARRLLLRGAR